jgi:hypothetical protein
MMSPQVAKQVATLILLVAILSLVVLVIVVQRWLDRRFGLFSGSKGLMISLWMMGAIFCISLFDAVHGNREAALHVVTVGAIIAGIHAALGKSRSG